MINTDLTLSLNILSYYARSSPFTIDSITLVGDSVNTSDQTMKMVVDTGFADLTMVIENFLKTSDQTLVINSFQNITDQTLFILVTEPSQGVSTVTRTLVLPFTIGIDSAMTQSPQHLLIANSDGVIHKLYVLEKSELAIISESVLDVALVGVVYVNEELWGIQKNTNNLVRLNMYTGLIEITDNDSGVFPVPGVVDFGSNSGLSYSIVNDTFFLIDGASRFVEYDRETNVTVFKQALVSSNFGGLEYDQDNFFLRTNNRTNSIFKLRDTGGVALSVSAPANSPPSSLTDIARDQNRAYTIHVNYRELYVLNITNTPEVVKFQPSKIEPSVLDNQQTELKLAILDQTESVLEGLKTSALVLQKIDMFKKLAKRPEQVTSTSNDYLLPAPFVIDQENLKSLVLFDNNSDSSIRLVAGDEVVLDLDQNLVVESLKVGVEFDHVLDFETLESNQLKIEYSYDGVNFNELFKIILSRDLLETTSHIDQFIDRSTTNIQVKSIRVVSSPSNTQSLLLHTLEIYTKDLNASLVTTQQTSDYLGNTLHTLTSPRINGGNLIYNSTFNHAYKGWKVLGDGEVRPEIENDHWSTRLVTSNNQTLSLTSQLFKISSEEEYFFNVTGIASPGSSYKVQLEFLDIDQQRILVTESLVFSIQSSTQYQSTISPYRAYWCRVLSELDELGELSIHSLSLTAGEQSAWTESDSLDYLVKAVVEY